MFNHALTTVKQNKEKQSDQFFSLLDTAREGDAFLFNELYGTFLENALERGEQVKENFVGVFSYILPSKSPLSDDAINGILGIVPYQKFLCTCDHLLRMYPVTLSRYAVHRFMIILRRVKENYGTLTTEYISPQNA